MSFFVFDVDVCLVKLKKELNQVGNLGQTCNLSNALYVLACGHHKLQALGEKEKIEK